MNKLSILGVAFLAATIQAAELPGKVVFEKSKCDGCHAKDGKGNAGMAKILGVDVHKMDLTQIPATAKDDDLKKQIEKGKDKMPAYGKKLKAEEIDALVAYVRSLTSPAK